MAFSQREFLAFSRQPCRPVCLGLPFCHRTKRSPQHREPSSAAAAAAQLHAVAQTLFMNKAIPTGNKLLAKRERERQQKLHEARIKSMKPSVDNRPPPVYAHMVDKKKRDQLLEDRYLEIERENRKLLDAMTKIMAKNTFADVQSSHDAELAHMRNLNRLARQRELDRIANANMNILHRIQTKEPYYDRKEWSEHEHKHVHLLEKLREFPYHPERGPVPEAAASSASASAPVTPASAPAVARAGTAAASSRTRPAASASASGAVGSPLHAQPQPPAASRAAAAAAAGSGGGNARARVSTAPAPAAGKGKGGPYAAKLNQDHFPGPPTSVARPVSHATVESPDGRRIHRLDRRIGDCNFTLNILLDETARGVDAAPSPVSSPSASSSSSSSSSSAASAASAVSKAPAKRTWHVSAFDPARAAELLLTVDGDVLLATLAKEVKRPPPEDPARREEYLVDALAARLRVANGALVFAEHGGA